MQRLNASHDTVSLKEATNEMVSIPDSKVVTIDLGEVGPAPTLLKAERRTWWRLKGRRSPMMNSVASLSLQIIQIGAGANGYSFCYKVH